MDCFSNMKLVVFRIITAILLIALMITIFCLSAQTSTESAGVSGGFTFKFFSLFYRGFKDLTDVRQNEITHNASFIIRKLAHFSLYFIMGLLSFLTVITYKKIKFFLRPIISFAICVAYSVSDEIHQLFIPGRSGELRDVFIDSSGALLAILILFLICDITKNLKHKLN